MNMPVLPVTSSSKPPTEAPARAADASVSDGPQTFSKVLSQQQGRPATGQQAASAPHAPGGQPHDEKVRDPLDPDTTLNLIMDSTALPLMQAQIQTPATMMPATTTAQVAGAAATASATQADARSLATPAAAVLLASLASTSQKPAGAAAPAAGPQAQTGPSPSENLGSLLAPATTLPAFEKTPAVTDRSDSSSLALTAAVAVAQRTEGGTSPGAAGLPASTATSPSAHAATATASALDAANGQAALFGSPVTAAGLPTSPAAQAFAPVITLAVPTPLASAQWAQDLGRQLAMVAQAGPNGMHTVHLHVNPPELGPVHITLQIGDTLTQAAFVSPHAHVRQALENALPRLEQQFAQAGLSLGQANVSDQQTGQQGFAQPPAPPRNPSGAAFNLEIKATGAGALAVHAPNPTGHPDALVDTFA
ncbi:MAG: flagellar hook-length control protein FliK [Castellaniella sp.]|uniref:flagellar hook-length control protein FliK n=1 Tax=Castellaniella sp. TaxID=1955812 RepID=UPI0011F513B0|nr:flagellar hook-length control protein FliK [Castellaniella sp.]TAN27728.1 MAG: flagellar hook-length control protein FliK [Castellaniella sp.]